MDKYQKFAIKRVIIKGDKTLKSLVWDYKKIIVKQNENYNLTKYTILIQHASIIKIEYFIGDVMYCATRVDEYQHSIEIDFNKRITFIRLYFVEKVVEPIDIEIEYEEADKLAYDKKIEEEHKKNLTEKAKVVVKTGNSLINVTFQPVNTSFAYSKVELYAITGDKVVDNKHINEYQLMAKYKTDENVYFHSITGLAYGKYAVILIEYDSENNEIFRSDYIEVSLSRPNYGGYNRGPGHVGMPY